MPERDVLDGMYKELEELREQLKQGAPEVSWYGSARQSMEELKAKIKAGKEAGVITRMFTSQHQKHKAQEY